VARLGAFPPETKREVDRALGDALALPISAIAARR